MFARLMRALIGEATLTLPARVGHTLELGPDGYRPSEEWPARLPVKLERSIQGWNVFSSHDGTRLFYSPTE